MFKRLIATAALLALPVLADDQKPFDATTIAAHISYLNNRVAPEVDLGLRMGSTGGFTAYEVTGFAVTALKGSPTTLSTTAVTGVALVRPVGEYVYWGLLGQGGVGNNGKNTAMVGDADFVAGYRFGHSQHWSAELVLGAERSPLGTYVPKGALGVRYGFNAKVSLPAPATAK